MRVYTYGTGSSADLHVQSGIGARDGVVSEDLDPGPVYDLLFMAQASPADCEYIRRRGTEPIRYLADNSIVFNVRDPAKELLALVEPPKR